MVTCSCLPVEDYVAGLGQLLNEGLHEQRGFLPWSSPWDVPIHELSLRSGEVEQGITLGYINVVMYHLGFLCLE